MKAVNQERRSILWRLFLRRLLTFLAVFSALTAITWRLS